MDTPKAFGERTFSESHTVNSTFHQDTGSVLRQMLRNLVESSFRMCM